MKSSTLTNWTAPMRKRSLPSDNPVRDAMGLA